MYTITTRTLREARTAKTIGNYLEIKSKIKKKYEKHSKILENPTYYIIDFEIKSKLEELKLEKELIRRMIQMY